MDLHLAINQRNRRARNPKYPSGQSQPRLVAAFSRSFLGWTRGIGQSRFSPLSRKTAAGVVGWVVHKQNALARNPYQITNWSRSNLLQGAGWDSLCLNFLWEHGVSNFAGGIADLADI